MEGCFFGKALRGQGTQLDAGPGRYKAGRAKEARTVTPDTAFTTGRYRYFMIL